MGLGDRYRVRTGFERLGSAVAQNARAGAHLWVLMTTYGLTDAEAANSLEGVDTVLDRDHLLAVAPVGCYICEQPYSYVVGKPCTGEPK